MKAVLFYIAGNFYKIFAGGFIGYWRRHATYIHPNSLHGVGFIREGICIGYITAHFKCSFGIVFYNLPESGDHVFCAVNFLGQ